MEFFILPTALTLILLLHSQQILLLEKTACFNLRYTWLYRECFEYYVAI
jgi:hypothetical protein